MTSALTNQRRIFKAFLTQTERLINDVTCKISTLDFTYTKVVLEQPRVTSGQPLTLSLSHQPSNCPGVLSAKSSILFL